MCVKFHHHGKTNAFATCNSAFMLVCAFSSRLGSVSPRFSSASWTVYSWLVPKDGIQFLALKLTIMHDSLGSSNDRNTTQYCTTQYQ